MPEIRLVPIAQEGSPTEDLGLLADDAKEVCAVTASFYQSSGFLPPWVGYLALSGSTVVGTCGFKGPPVAGSVEIAYYTFPGSEGQGIATEMARRLINTARQADPGITVIAQTLPEPNASNAILKKVGFGYSGVVTHPEDGEVWEWRLPPLV
jgi:[ribosomal protein S5]-alanine N-acetyltransferase